MSISFCSASTSETRTGPRDSRSSRSVSAARVDIADGIRFTALAPNGLTGTWLVDPNDYTVAEQGGNETAAALAARLAGGNPTLLPEKSRQGSLGFRFDPVSSLSIGADYWWVALKDRFGQLDEATVFGDPRKYVGAWTTASRPRVTIFRAPSLGAFAGGTPVRDATCRAMASAWLKPRSR